MPIDYNDLIVHDFRLLFDTNDLDIGVTINTISEPQFVTNLFAPFVNQVNNVNWISENWTTAIRYGYIQNVDRFKPLLDIQYGNQLNIPDNTTLDNFKYFFSNRINPRHWGLARNGAPLTDNFFDQNGQINIENRNAILNRIQNLTINQIQEDNILTEIYGQNSDYPIFTSIIHLIYPYIFPAWLKTTKKGYSQISGLNRLIDDICFYLQNNNLTVSKKLNLNFNHNYHHYSAAYRFLLRLYQIWRGDQFANPHFDCFTQFLAEMDPKPIPQKMLEMKKSLILYGVPGTGKTHKARELAAQIAAPQNIKFVQFHPNYSYADFIIGIKPESTANGNITYPTVPGLLYRIAAEAHYLRQQQSGAEQPDPKSRNIVLIIDEINRANLAAVLGEVMYLLEYRGKTLNLPQILSPGTPITRVPEMDAAVGGNLGGQAADQLGDPFNRGNQFALPDNLFIIGTMNHADRSIAGFDMALRRRFAWYRTEPDYEALATMIKNNGGDPSIMDNSLEAFIKSAEDLNNKIEREASSIDLPLTKDHLIGHAYFAEIGSIVRSESPNATQIERQHREILWLYYILPLLEDFLGSEVNRSTKGLGALCKILVGD